MRLRISENQALFAFAGALTMSVAVSAAGVTWHALGYYPEEVASAAVRPVIPTAPLDITPILAFAPFGAPVQSDTAPTEASAGNYTLRGVILAYPQQRSSALISGADGQIRTLAIGETLGSGVVLESIAPDHVVLTSDGRRERLAFPIAHTSAGVAAIRATIPGLAATPPTAQTAPQEVIDTYRQKIADNPQTVIDELGLSASAEGYRVGENLAPDVRKAGLQPGDRVVRVNGVPVGDIEKDRQNFENIAASGRARVEVIRDDRLLILSFPLR